MSDGANKSAKRNDGLVVAGGGNERPASGDSDNSGGSVGRNDGLVVIDPGSLGDPDTTIGAGSDSGGGGNSAGGNAGGSAKPKRKYTRRKKGKALDVKGVEAILFSMHNILATFTKVPELALDQEESKQLAQGISKVSSHYDLEATELAMDWTHLISVCVMIYGTRFYVLRQKAINRQAVPVGPVNSGQPREGSPESVDIPGVGPAQFGSGTVQ